MACNSLNPICDVAEAIGSLGSTVTSSVFNSVASAFGNTADSAINWLWQQLSTSTSISLGGANFELDLGIVVSIAAVVCLGLFVIQMTLSALKHDAGGIGRALRGLVIATVGCAITLASLEVLLGAVDDLCVGVVKIATGRTIATMGTKIIGGAVFTTAIASPPTILILSLVAICAVAIVWFALVIRKMLIIITAIFAPLAFAGGVADLSRGWVRKWLEAVLALVFSKLILIIIFIIGLGVLGGMGSPSGATPLSAITEEITGLLILLVAGFSPWMALRIVHFTGDHVATMAGSASHASAGASAVVGAPQKAAQMKYSAMMLSGGRSGSVAPPPGSGLGPLAGGTASARAGATAAGAAAGAATGGATLAASAGVEAGKRVHAAAARGAEPGAATEKPAGSGASASGAPRRSGTTGQTPGLQSSTPSPAAGDSSASRPTPSPTQRRAEADAPQTPLAQQRAPHSPTPPASSASTSPSVPPPPFPASPPESRKQ
jgi:type IV secretion system protein TrbL